MKIKLKDTNQFKRIIVLNGFTGRMFGEKVGISSTYANHIINGKQNISPKVAKKIVDELKVEFDDIFFIEDGL